MNNQAKYSKQITIRLENQNKEKLGYVLKTEDNQTRYSKLGTQNLQGTRDLRKAAFWSDRVKLL